MSKINDNAFQNLLLRALSPEDSDWLYRRCKEIDLHLRKQIEVPNSEIGSVVFPESGIVSVVISSGPGFHTEGGIIGKEGMTGVPVILGTDRFPYSSYMQVAGRGHEVSAQTIRDLMNRSEAARKVFLNFAQTFLLQVSETAVANARARIDLRLARWLLMAADRLDNGYLPITHEFLAMMMGTRRAGVTVALAALASKGLVSPGRGKIAILDRVKLEAAAGRFYGLSEAEYRRMLPTNGAVTPMSNLEIAS
jgi:CRP-like cAMP-binding protein